MNDEKKKTVWASKKNKWEREDNTLRFDALLLRRASMRCHSWFKSSILSRITWSKEASQSVQKVSKLLRMASLRDWLLTRSAMHFYRAKRIISYVDSRVVHYVTTPSPLKVDTRWKIIPPFELSGDILPIGCYYYRTTRFRFGSLIYQALVTFTSQITNQSLQIIVQ